MSEDKPGQSPPPERPPERWLSFLGFVIVAKADLLAAAAFLLSAAGLIYQFSAWISGPKPSLYTPDVAYIFFDAYANNRVVTRLAGQVSLVNSGAMGHDTIVRSLEVTIEANGQPITVQNWMSFASVTRKDRDLVVTPLEAAHPFPVNAGSAVSRMVSFAPGDIACYATSNSSSVAPGCDPDKWFVSDSDFLNRIAGASELRLTFSASIVGSSVPVKATCTVASGMGLLQYLAENNWFAARCRPVEAR